MFITVYIGFRDLFFEPSSIYLPIRMLFWARHQAAQR
nr:MAG TPA: hypothetical protein [Caudoviricetes sp.]